jgi:hypothetical protein
MSMTKAFVRHAQHVQQDKEPRLNVQWRVTLYVNHVLRAKRIAKMMIKVLAKSVVLVKKEQDRHLLALQMLILYVLLVLFRKRTVMLMTRACAKRVPPVLLAKAQLLRVPDRRIQFVTIAKLTLPIVPRMIKVLVQPARHAK